MDLYAYGRMRPLYEAMTVCSAAIGWFERQESEWTLQSDLGGLVRVIEDFIAAASCSDLLADAPPEVISGSIYCLAAVNAMTQIITTQVRERVSQFSERFQGPIVAFLGQLDHLTERVEGILEAWHLSVDPELSAKIKMAVESIDHSKTDIADWREALELIHS